MNQDPFPSADTPGSAAGTDAAAPRRFTLGRALQLEPAQARRAVPLFVQLFAAGGIFILGRTVRDTLFLSRYPLEILPWMFVAFGVSSALLAVFYNRFGLRVARPTLLYGTSAVGILTYAAVWLAVRAGLRWIYPVFYVWSEIVSTLLVLQFWTFAAEMDQARNARPLHALLASARPLSTVLFGAVAAVIVGWLGTEQLLFVVAGLMLVFMCCTYLLRKVPRMDAGAAARRVRPAPARSESGYFRILSVFVLVMFVALTVGDYQFKLIARSNFSETDLARFFSLFYSVVGTLAFLFQLSVTPRLLARFGVGTALTVMPGLFGAAGAALLAWPGLAAACVLKFADNGLQFTLHETTMQSLFAPFSTASRARSRGLLDGAVKPLSYGAGGLLLVLLQELQLHVREISWVTLGLALLWQSLVPAVRRRYLSALERGLAGPLRSQVFEEPFVVGLAERRVLIRALSDPNPVLCLVALGQLQGETSEPYRQALYALLRRPEPGLRARALQLLEDMGDTTAIAEFIAASTDSDDAVRAAAAAALARFVADQNPELLWPFLEDPSVDVRTAVVVRLLKYGGLEASTRAGERLLALVESPGAENRLEAIGVLGQLGHAAYLPLQKLLSDPNPGVRRSALRAAGRNGDIRLAPSIVARLREPGVRQTALAALSELGEPAVPQIERALRDPDMPRAVRLELPRTLRRIAAPAALACLERLPEDPDSHMRLRIYASVARLRETLGRPPVPAARIAPRVRREVLESTGNILAWQETRVRFGTRLMAEEMEFRMRRAERRIMRLFQWSYGVTQIDVILNALDFPERRSAALDALEALLDPALKQMVFPLLEHRSGAGPTPLSPLASLCILPPVEFMLVQASHPNPYVIFVALDALARAGESRGTAAARRALAHEDPLVREAGLRALCALESASIPESAESLANDPDEAVRKWAAALRTGGQALTNAGEAGMYGTIEKILLLKSTALFSSLTGEDLAPLARVAGSIALAPGEVLFGPDSPADHFCVVITGSLVLESQGHELRRVGPHETIGELAVLDRKPQNSTARALEASELLRIGAEEFFEILNEQPQIAEAMIRILAGQVREAHRRLTGRPRP